MAAPHHLPRRLLRDAGLLQISLEDVYVLSVDEDLHGDSQLHLRDVSAQDVLEWTERVQLHQFVPVEEDIHRCSPPLPKDVVGAHAELHGPEGVGLVDVRGLEAPPERRVARQLGEAVLAGDGVGAVGVGEDGAPVDSGHLRDGLPQLLPRMMVLLREENADGVTCFRGLVLVSLQLPVGVQAPHRVPQVASHRGQLPSALAVGDADLDLPPVDLHSKIVLVDFLG
mmetsp:Transcript_107316/g.269111  ORF Transcript_107316/g.269111 Transcript_107316/m.269111 type:complete len:226 (-) Transcript_107316:217-894(-)